MYGIKLFIDYFAGNRPKKDRKLYNALDKGLLASSGVFLDIVYTSQFQSALHR